MRSLCSKLIRVQKVGYKTKRIIQTFSVLLLPGDSRLFPNGMELGSWQKELLVKPSDVPDGTTLPAPWANMDAPLCFQQSITWCVQAFGSLALSPAIGNVELHLNSSILWCLGNKGCFLQRATLFHQTQTRVRDVPLVYLKARHRPSRFPFFASSVIADQTLVKFLPFTQVPELWPILNLSQHTPWPRQFPSEKRLVPGYNIL